MNDLFSKELTQEILKYWISYQPETGEFRWRKHRASKHKNSGSTGYYDNAGYLMIGIDGRPYGAHRLAWLYMYGYLPSMIDHINGDRSDNRIDNLREVSGTLNHRNIALRRDNKSGYHGIRKTKQGTYAVQIYLDGKRKELGTFKTLDDAIVIRKQAERKHGFHINHGRKK